MRIEVTFKIWEPKSSSCRNRFISGHVFKLYLLLIGNLKVERKPWDPNFGLIWPLIENRRGIIDLVVLHERFIRFDLVHTVVINPSYNEKPDKPNLKWSVGVMQHETVQNACIERKLRLFLLLLETKSRCVSEISQIFAFKGARLVWAEEVLPSY